MSCELYCERCQPYVDGQVPEAERAQIDAHLASCTRCSAIFHTQARMQRTFAKATLASAGPASELLRERIMIALDSAVRADEDRLAATSIFEKKPARRATPVILPLAAAAAVMLLLSGFVAAQLFVVQPQSAWVRTLQHEHDAVMAGSRSMTKTENISDLTTFVAAKVGIAPTLPNLAGCELKPVGCGEASGILKGAFVKYEQCACERKPCTIFITDCKEPLEGKVVSLNGRSGRAAVYAGRTVISWKGDNGLTYILVTEAPTADALAVAELASK